MPTPTQTPAATTQQPPAGTDPGMLTSWYQDYMASTPTAQQATTTNWTPGRDATVQGQVANITDAGGPLMQRAETRARQQMNGRGLLNSSMAVGAGQSALYDAALPIAQQDANTFARAGEFNAGAKNAASTFNAGQANAALTQQRGAGITSEQTAQEVAEANRVRSQQTSERLGSQTFAAGEREAAQNFATIRDSAQFGQQTGMQREQLAFQSAQSALDRAQQLAITDKSAAAQQALLKAQQDFNAAQAQMDRAATVTRDAAQFQNRLIEINAQTDAAIRQHDALAGTDLYTTYRDVSQQTYDSYISAVQQIQTSDMDPDIKAAQVANLQMLFSKRQEFINSMFAETPKWADEWSQFALSFGG